MVQRLQASKVIFGSSTKKLLVLGYDDAAQGAKKLAESGHPVLDPD